MADPRYNADPDPATVPDPSTVPVPVPVPDRSRRLGLGHVRVLAAAALLGAIAFLALTSDRLPELDAGRLEAARKLWAERGPSSYRLAIEMSGSDLAASTYRVSVRDGRVEEVLRDGQAITGDPAAYSVPGLFRWLAEELRLAASPGSSFGAPAGYRAYNYAEVDPANGLPRRFRRVVGGTARWAEWRITSFE